MKQYEVIGDRETLGHQPGEFFEMDLPEAQEERLLKRGSIRVAGQEEAPEEQPEESSSEGGGEFGQQADDYQEVNNGG